MFSASLDIDLDSLLSATHEFKGRFKADVSVQMYGMFKGCISIANVCTQIAQVLAKEIDGFACHSYNGEPFFSPDLENYNFLNKAAPVGFFYGFPDAVPDFFFDHELTVGGFVCETTAIPQQWVAVCNRFDLIIVPSQFCKRVFQASGVSSPIKVVHHGLEADYYPMSDKHRQTPLIFYSTFSESFPERKGCEELIRSFKRAFADSKQAQLRLRVQQNSKLLHYLNKYDAHDLILLDNSNNLSTVEFAKIYSEVHCTVFPSKGEGFGLIPFQSIACDTPVIAPYSTGMTEYLNKNNAMLLKTKGETIDANVYYKSGSYYSIDEAHLVELLHHTVDNWKAEYQAVRRVSGDFRQRFCWHNVLQDFQRLISRLINSNNISEKQNLIRHST